MTSCRPARLISRGRRTPCTCGLLTYSGCPASASLGKFDKAKVLALPDTGSEQSLVSHKYAKSRAWLIDLDFSCINLLQFQMAVPRGKKDKCKRSGASSTSRAASCKKRSCFDVYVLYGCPFDIVLGEGILEETYAFVQNAAAMLDVFTDAATADHNLVIW
jgi:hypothetical protein